MRPLDGKKRSRKLWNLSISAGNSRSDTYGPEHPGHRGGEGRSHLGGDPAAPEAQMSVMDKIVLYGAGTTDIHTERRRQYRRAHGPGRSQVAEV